LKTTKDQMRKLSLMTNRYKKIAAIAAIAIAVIAVIYSCESRKWGRWIFIGANGETREGRYRSPLGTLDEVSQLAGKSSGTLQLFSSSSQLGAEYQFSNGMFHGEAKQWNKNGQMTMRAFYSQDKLDGLYTAWYHNGIKANEVEYRNNLKTGRSLAWHENGRMKTDGNYVDGLNHGWFRRWLPDGTLVADGVYSNMWAQNGTFIIEKKEGSPPVIGVYSNGVFVKKYTWLRTE